jgi:hypothetical protein
VTYVIFLLDYQELILGQNLQDVKQLTQGMQILRSVHALVEGTFRDSSIIEPHKGFDNA